VSASSAIAPLTQLRYEASPLAALPSPLRGEGP
jgi:hypothetical protein